jgi:hypothetical protein
MQPNIITKIQDFPSKIEDKKQLQRFLGFLTHAEEFIQKLAEMRKPLQGKIKKDIKWEWTEKDTKYIDKIKSKIKTLPPMYIPKEEDQLIIETDVSQSYWEES